MPKHVHTLRNFAAIKYIRVGCSVSYLGGNEDICFLTRRQMFAFNTIFKRDISMTTIGTMHKKFHNDWSVSTTVRTNGDISTKRCFKQIIFVEKVTFLIIFHQLYKSILPMTRSLSSKEESIFI